MGLDHKRRCCFVTNAGTPCTRNAFSGSSFCWWHCVRGRDWGMFWFGVGISVLIAFAVSGFFYFKAERDNIRRASLYRPRVLSLRASFPLRFFEGSAVMYVTSPLTVMMTNRSPFRVTITGQGEVLFNGDLRDNSGDVVAEIRNSTLQLIDGSRYDVNSDSRGFEVVDKEGVPVLQLYFADASSMLRLNYVTYVPKSDRKSVQLIYCNRLRCYFGPVDDNEVAVARQDMEPVFRYPSSQFFGQRKPKLVVN